MYYLDETYQPQTPVSPQLRLQPLPTAGLIQTDTISSIKIKRNDLKILEIDHSIPARLRTPVYKGLAEPMVLSEQDSLMLNLKGLSHTHTNLNLQLKPNTNEFSETAYTQFNSDFVTTTRQKREMLAQNSDSLTLFGSNENDSLKLIQPENYTEKGQVQHHTLAMEKPPLREEWFLVVIAISLLMTGLVRLNWGSYLKNMIQSIAFSNAMGKLEGSNVSNLYPSFILGFLFYFNTSIFIFQILTLSARGFLGFESFVIIPIIFMFLLVLFSLKVWVYKLVGHIFETVTPVREYLFGSSIMSKAYGILVIPLILFIPFVDENAQQILIKVGLGLFILLYMMQLARGVRIILSNTFSVYYIILYLCALEILPLTMLFKVIFR